MLFVTLGIKGMVGVFLENNRYCFFSGDFTSCDMLLLVKSKAASCKCLSDKSFLNTEAFPTPLICYMTFQRTLNT